MKKRVLRTCVAAVMVVAMAFVAMPAGKAKNLHRDWYGFGFNPPQLVVPPSGSSVDTEKAALEKKIEQSDAGYSRETAIGVQQNFRNKIKAYTQITVYLKTLLSANRPKWDLLGGSVSIVQPSTPPTEFNQPAQPPSQPTPTPSAIPTPQPTPTPTPTVPDPVTPVQYNTPTSYYFTSSGDQWQEVWYNTSSLMYLRGSVPADCDTSRTDCWQLSFDLDGETVTVQGNGCTDWRGTSLDVSFHFDDDLINEVESYFIKGGDNVPLTFRYYAGNTLKKASVSGQPKLMLTYDGWLKLYVAK